MSISLRSVTLSNIRHHEYFRFEPAGEGVTAIRGATGAGKSSIVDSIAWVLYGVKPRGVTKNSSIMRDQAKWGEDKFYAQVVLSVDDTIMKIERRIVSKTGTVECDVWEVPQQDYVNDEVFTDQTHRAGASVTSAEAYIRSRLKMDSKGFLAAVLVQQKQVDSLVTSSASERAQVIEKLTGISAVTVALKKAREKSGEYKKTLNATNVDEKKSTELHREIESLTNEIDDLTGRLENQTQKCSSAKKVQEEKQSEFNRLSRLYETQEENRKRTVENTALIQSLKDDLAEVNEEKTALKKEIRLIAGTGVPDASKVRDEMVTVQSSLGSVKSKQAEIERNVSAWKKEIEQIDRIVAASNISNIDDAVHQQQKHLSLAEEKRQEASQHVADGKAVESEISKLRRAIEVLTEGEGTCPTCLQKVSSIGVVLEKLGKDIEESEKKIEQYRDLYRNATLELKENTAKAEGLGALVESIRNREAVNQSVLQGQEELVSLRGQVKALEAQVESTKTLLMRAEEHESMKSRYDEMASRALKISNRIEDKEREKDALKQADSSTTVTLKKLTSLRTKVEEATSRSHKEELTRMEIESRIQLAQEKVNSATIQVQKVDDEIAKYR